MKQSESYLTKFNNTKHEIISKVTWIRLHEYFLEKLNHLVLVWFLAKWQARYSVLFPRKHSACNYLSTWSPQTSQVHVDGNRWESLVNIFFKPNQSLLKGHWTMYINRQICNILICCKYHNNKTYISVMYNSKMYSLIFLLPISRPRSNCKKNQLN